MSDMDEEERPPRPPHEWKKRKRTLESYLSLGASSVAIIGGCAVALGWFLDAVPFVKAASYNVDKAHSDARLAQIEGQVNALTGDMSSIKRNGVLTLQLQLRQRVDLLTTTLAATPRASTTYFAIQSELLTTQQELDEVTRQLNR